MFEFLRMNNNSVGVPTIKQLPTTASVTYKVGDALYLASGKLALATGTQKPSHICAEDYTAPASGMKAISANPINSDMEWLTTFAAAPTALNMGDKVTIHTDAEQVTATTTGGVVELVKLYGTASGSKVVVKC